MYHPDKPVNENLHAFSPVLTCTVRAAFTLHARPAARLVQAIQHFDAELVLVRDQARVDARSILEILSLSIQEGDWLEVEGSGAEAGAALEALSRLFTSGFEE